MFQSAFENSESFNSYGKGGGQLWENIYNKLAFTSDWEIITNVGLAPVPSDVEAMFVLDLPAAQKRAARLK